jgi:hypothetical protein
MVQSSALAVSTAEIARSAPIRAPYVATFTTLSFCDGLLGLGEKASWATGAFQYGTF